MYKSNSLILTPHELRTFSDSVNFSRVTELVVVDEKRHKPDRSLYNFMKFILACIAKHERHPQVEQLKLCSLTVRTSTITYKELQGLLKDTSTSPFLKPSSTGVGRWTLASTERFGISLVHEQLSSAWRSLQSCASNNLEHVTKVIVQQGDKSPSDHHKLVEPYLHRAILAVKLWVAAECDHTVLRRMNWFSRSAIAFVEPYICETMRPGAAKTVNGQSEIDLINSVLLQVVS